MIANKDAPLLLFAKFSCQLLFLTMLEGPSKNTDDVTLSYSLFLIWRGNISVYIYVQYIQYDTIKYIDCIYVWIPLNEKTLTWGGGHHCTMLTSLHSGPMWKIDCHFPTSHWPTPSPSSLPFQSHLNLKHNLQ
jgi:hypothetical protein